MSLFIMLKQLAHMKVNKKNFNIIIIFIVLLFPISLFGDGGMPRRECTKITYYDIQPTTLSSLKLELKTLKINGKTVQNINTIKTIEPINSSGYRMNRSVMDTLHISAIEISQDNKSIISVYIASISSMDFLHKFVKK